MAFGYIGSMRTKAAIAAALPLLTGEFSGQKVEIVGGPGVS